MSIYDDVVLNEEDCQRNFSTDVLTVDLVVQVNYTDLQLLVDFLNEQYYFVEIYHDEYSLLVQALIKRLRACLKKVIKLKVNINFNDI
jgi:hypothetical protein